MGDRSSSECSWKKMVIAKSNNEWTSTMKTEKSANLNPSTMNTTDFCIDESKYDFVIKRENDDDNVDGNSTENEVESMVQEMDPLFIQTPASLSEPSKRIRRKSSGPKNETLEERAVRLAKMSAYAARRLANETPEQRALRLKRMSEYAAKRLAQESSEQRARRLARMSAYSAKRLANESPEQRRARLLRMSAYAAKRQSMKKVVNTSHSNDINSAYSSYGSDVLPNKS